MIDPMPLRKPLDQLPQAGEPLLVLDRAFGSEVPEALRAVAKQDGIGVCRWRPEVVLKVARPMVEPGLGFQREPAAAALVDAINESQTARSLPGAEPSLADLRLALPEPIHHSNLLTTLLTILHLFCIEKGRVGQVCYFCATGPTRSPNRIRP